MGTPSQALQSGATTESSEPRLRRGWLVLARATSALIVGFALVVFVASVSVAFAQMRIACASPCASGQLTSAQMQSLHQLGISVNAFVTVELVISILTSLVWFGIAAVVFWRRSDNLVPLLVAVQLVTQGASIGANALTGSASTWQTPATALVTLNSILFGVFLAIFPSGRFVPHWIGWILIPGCTAEAIGSLPGAPGALRLVFIITLFVLLAAQVYRYRAVSTGILRQQTKWALLGITASFLAQVGLLIPLVLVPRLSAPESLYPLIAGTIADVALTLGPIGFMFGVLRYRLYDIDIIINRALVYGTLSAILVTVYFASVLGAQAIVQAVTGQSKSQPVFIVASTLLIAALFNPLRHRIQEIIDQRFYRRKYDAAKTLAAFSASLRNQVDLAELRQDIVDVVEETMQPAYASLWLRDPQRTGGLPETPAPDVQKELAR